MPDDRKWYVNGMFGRWRDVISSVEGTSSRLMGTSSACGGDLVKWWLWITVWRVKAGAVSCNEGDVQRKSPVKGVKGWHGGWEG